ncbi:hypothetical protein TSUD_235560 [Trifolium subterraneum]|nr:hypothetical protein TSUD_235560 [Trifolium subterraneum]
MSWTFGLIFLPIRAVNAIQRESQCINLGGGLRVVGLRQWWIIYDHHDGGAGPNREKVHAKDTAKVSLSIV